MKLIELLSVLSLEMPVGIWNIDDKRAKCPTPQTYQKVRNIPFEKIRNIAEYDVLNACLAENGGGLLIRVHDKSRLEMSLQNSDLARKICAERQR